MTAPAAPPPEQAPAPPPARATPASVKKLVTQVIAAANDPYQRALLRRELIAIECRGSFASFARAAWEIVEPSTQLIWGRHHDLVCAILQGMFEDWHRAKHDPSFLNKVRNVAMNLPPGTAKSKFVSVFFPPWCWLYEPGMQFLVISVNEDVTLRDARASRDILRSDWYQQLFRPKWKLKDDQDALSNYGNTEGGVRISKPAGSEVIGLRGDVILGDDLNNPKKSEEAAERDKVNTTWDENVYNRINDPIRSIRIGVQHRTHEEDWTGHVVARQGVWSPENPDGWLVVALPAEFEPSRRCATPWGGDWRVDDGEPLHPERMTPEYLRSERERLQDKYAGLMQQRPAAAEGGRVKREWWGFFRLPENVRPELDQLGYTGAPPDRPRPAHCETREDAPPLCVGVAPGGARFDIDWLVISLDPAMKKTERGSNHGVLVVAGKGNRRFVLDDRTQRGEATDVVRLLRELVLLWKPDKIYVEDKAAGAPIMAMLREQMREGDLPPVVVESVDPGSQDKQVRLDGVLPTLANGLVYLLDGAPWVTDFVEEFSVFPNGANDDRVDALSQCLQHQREAEAFLPSW